MMTARLGATLLVLSLGAVPAATLAQGIPDHIPDTPGESPADREKDRLEERYRGLLSRFYTAGSVDLAPLTRDGLGYQANINVGMNVGGGDAVFLAFAARDVPLQLTEDPVRPGRQPEGYVAVGYMLRGTRLLGPSRLAQRSALNVSVGVLSGAVSALAFEVAPTYDILVRDSWSVPAGVKLSVATVRGEEASVTRSFVGLSLGVRWQWARRDRLE